MKDDTTFVLVPSYTWKTRDACMDFLGTIMTDGNEIQRLFFSFVNSRD